MVSCGGFCFPRILCVGITDWFCGGHTRLPEGRKRMDRRQDWNNARAATGARELSRKNEIWRPNHFVQRLGKRCGHVVPCPDVCFVSAAVLWDRGVYHYIKPTVPKPPPSPCPRFLAHMRASTTDRRCRRFQRSYNKAPPPQGGGAQQHPARGFPRSQRNAGVSEDDEDDQERCASAGCPRNSVLLKPQDLSSAADISISTPPCPPSRLYQSTLTQIETPLLQKTLAHSASPPMMPAVLSSAAQVDRDCKVEGFVKIPAVNTSPPDWGCSSPDTNACLSDRCGRCLSSIGRPASGQFIFRGSSSLLTRETKECGVSEDEQGGGAVFTPSSQAELPGFPSSSSSPPGWAPTPTKPSNTVAFVPNLSFLGNCQNDAGFTSVPSEMFNPSPNAAPPPPSPTELRQSQVSPRWPVLPPIRGGNDTPACCCSRLSSTHTDEYGKLEALTPSTSSITPRNLSQGSVLDISLPIAAELSLLGASLSLCCDSGVSTSLSRVQLLLLDHNGPLASPPLLLPDWQDPITGDGTITHMPGAMEEFRLNDQSQGDSIDSSLCPERSSSLCSSPRLSSALSTDWEETGGADDVCHVPVSEEDVPTVSVSSYNTLSGDGERRFKALHVYTRLQESRDSHPPVGMRRGHSRFEDFQFLAKYCIFSPEKLDTYREAFNKVDTDADGFLTCVEVLLALKEIVPPAVLSEEEEIYICRILELVDFRVTDGLTDMKLFAVVASLTQKVAALDDYMRSLIGGMDFRSLEMKLSKAKTLFLFLTEARAGGPAPPCRGIGAEQLLLELKAGGIRQEHERAAREELRHVQAFDLLDFLAHLPLFLLIHNSVVDNPLDESAKL